MKWLMAEEGGAGGAGGAGEGGAAPAPEPKSSTPVPSGGGVGGGTPAPKGEGEKPAREDGRDEKGRYLNKDGTNAAAAPKDPPKFKTTVRVKYTGKDGKEVEEDEEVDEDRLKIAYQVERGLRIKAQEHAEERKKWETEKAEFFGRVSRGIHEDARHFLPEGVNPIEWHSKQLEALLAEHAQDPKDRQIAQLKGQLEEVAREKQEREQKEKDAGERREAVRMVDHIAKTVIPLTEKAGIPKNALALELATKHYYAARRQGIEDPDPELIAEEVIGEFAGSLEGIADKLDGRRALKLFPKLTAKITSTLREMYKERQAAANPAAPKKTEEERKAARGGNGEAKVEPPQRPRLMNDRELDRHLGIR